ncbi:MAG: bifunctional uroporphyrinogen-III C-methyltransferase/uroporphyrinogen-III synthase, partial [Pseudonocardia sp.]|nr:bifunctional uroporphyrinogen-III C-methyltransferase/uroporphyrinogen-III synthase [Pseudonocardia sp.]
MTFIGAGPGEPGLLTVLASQALSRADVVYADAAVPAAVTNLVGGELRGTENTPAANARAALAEARLGATVVRLVPGDVFTDENVVKEVLAVARTVVPFDIVPGISFGAATAAYAGVPIGSPRIEAELVDGPVLDVDALLHGGGTIVLTTRAADVVSIGEQLVALGVKPDTAVTVTSDGTGPT